ncbi:hypothetical protein NEMBOFW57_007213 [Staphylotrichum longicolle]|uniref:Family c-likeg-protein-coupled receptor protein n=1 Tax=Staphylotrichum longicolle TaxID=669026 RepID=A0AAD4HYV0_9PEZI|nr:hypothetical protein NEMBOFW57_007213 [Staphylotrichum longicolle]
MSSTIASTTSSSSTGTAPASTSSSGSAPQSNRHPHPPPPLPPKTAQLGGIPSPSPDITISVLLATLFFVAAAGNVLVYRRNRRSRYKFLFSALLVVFCAARVAALGLRCAWAAHPRDVRVAIAAQIFTAAGVLILFVTNLVFAQRVVRAYHPFFGWSKGVTALFGVLFASAVAVLAMVVAVTVQSFFVAEGDARRAVDRRVQLFCATYLAVYAFLPVPLAALAAVVPRNTGIDKFGEGHFRTKFALLTCTATLLTFGAAVRAVGVWCPRPLADPAWFHSKACYYCVVYVIEIIVVYAYTILRFDRRFHIPDGSSGPGHYSGAEYGTVEGSMAEAGDFARRKRKRKQRDEGGDGDDLELEADGREDHERSRKTPSSKSSPNGTRHPSSSSGDERQGSGSNSGKSRKHTWIRRTMS